MKYVITLVIAVLIILAVWLWVDPIPQDLNYHLFADNLTFLGVNHFWNVMSNLPFLLVGVMGLWSLQQGKLRVAADYRVFYWVFFIGVLFVGLGSSWYHLNPNNETLVWDRLPMTVAFMAFFSVVLAEHVNAGLGKSLLWPLIILGFASIVYWQYSESIGAGDLRWYGLVQFLPLLMIPVIFLAYPQKFTHSHLLWWFLGMYVVAKLLEHFDQTIFSGLQVISGHSLKHIAAAFGIYLYWRYLRLRVGIR
ncbi:ceramidase domain-containing protein [Marinicella meishanensis]|uniref:ceramidase domain-containing protein n=1 Tax=Marinicella meishanensis TaxID=2873263 RepID=UPI001CC0E517|nr:ceramidase domain-containing protein [Marinicella sp. NBU2979]